MRENLKLEVADKSDMFGIPKYKKERKDYIVKLIISLYFFLSFIISKQQFSIKR